MEQISKFVINIGNLIELNNGDKVIFLKYSKDLYGLYVQTKVGEMFKNVDDINIGDKILIEINKKTEEGYINIERGDIVIFNNEEPKPRVNWSRDLWEISLISFDMRDWICKRNSSSLLVEHDAKEIKKKITIFL